MIKVVLLGACGSMGKLIGRLIMDDSELELIGAFDIHNIGKQYAGIVGAATSCSTNVQHTDDLDIFIEKNIPDVAVDFSIAEATEKNCLTLVNNGIKCVIGTTGLSGEFIKKLESSIRENKVPTIISSNMATGVNVFFKMASILTTYLDDWDIEIIEAHHHRKADNYSGTSLKILDIICETLGVNTEDVTKYGRTKGKEKRKIGGRNEIGIHCIRAGDIVGDHTILFAGPGERIELKHQAHSRECFANGTIKAIKYLNKIDRNDARIISTQEALGLNK
jgi:4-hydroxy-tetrahydrodipicolinate reductase